MDWIIAISTVFQSLAVVWAGTLYLRTRNWFALFLLVLFALMVIPPAFELASAAGNSITPERARATVSLVMLIIGMTSLVCLGFLHRFVYTRAIGDREVRFLSTALADSATPTLITDANTKPGGLVIEFANDAMLRLTGYEGHELIGRTMSQMFGPDEQHDTSSGVKSAIAGGLPIVTERTIRRKNGARRWVTCSMSSIRDKTGRASRLLWVKHDVTTRHEVEVQLKAEQQRYQRIVETATEGAWLVDENWRTTYVNARMAEMLGLPAKDILGRHVTDFVFEADRPALLANMRQREAGVRGGQHDERLRTASGDELWTIMSTNVFVDDAGAFAGALAMVTDIGDRRVAELELRAALQKLSFHVDNSPLAVIEWNSEFRVRSWSSGAERIFGWTPGEVIGKHPSEWRIIFEEDASLVADIINRLVIGAEPRNTCLNRNYTKNGEIIWCQWYNSVLFDPDGKVDSVVSLSQEITEQHRAEERQRLLMLELDHRVKNNLATVLGIAQQSLATSTSLEDFAPAFIGRVESLSRAHGLLARASWEGVDLHELSRRILDSEMRGAPPRITIEGPPISLSASQGSLLALTLHELMTNAVKYGALSCSGGRVQLGWSVEDTGGTSTLSLAWSEKGGPPVVLPDKAGFGTSFIKTGISYELGGRADMDYHESGLRCRIVIPLSSK